MIDTAEAARRLGVSPETLVAWRRLGKGPPFYRLGRRVVYDEAELKEWLSRRRVETRNSTSWSVGSDCGHPAPCAR